MTSLDDFLNYGFGGHVLDEPKKVKRSYRPGIKSAPTTAQREQRQRFLDAREHRTVVMNTHPSHIRAPWPSRQPSYGADEYNEDDGHE
jgi:hypothetical protein